MHLNGEFNPARIGVPLVSIVDGDGKDVRPASQLFGGRFAKIAGKSGDTANARGIIADKSDIKNWFQHRLKLSVSGSDSKKAADAF
jgi:hypothetical protein